MISFSTQQHFFQWTKFITCPHILSITNLAVSLNSRYYEKMLNIVSHLNKNDLFLSTSQKKYLSVLCHQFWHIFVWNNTILHVDLKKSMFQLTYSEHSQKFGFEIYHLPLPKVFICKWVDFESKSPFFTNGWISMTVCVINKLLLNH